MTRRRRLLYALAASLLIVFFLPLIVPVPPLEGTVPPDQLADPDSLFANISGLSIHYKTAGNGTPVILLLHGFGASVFSWREVMVPLGNFGTVIAFDRPSFGLTSRPMPGEWTGANPYASESQSDQTVALMDSLGIQNAILIGNSAGGTISVLTALRHPERVQALILIDPAIYSGGSPSWIQWFSFLPQVQKWGPYLARQIATQGDSIISLAWHNTSKITPYIIEGYHKPLKAQNWDRALWELTIASHPLGLDKQLSNISVPVLIITGDDDRIVPTNESIRLASEIPGSRLIVIPDCGHVPQEEQPALFMAAVEDFLSGLIK
jgi:pimeloyl-ACP methyl ester carboxylesterase